MSNKKSEIYAGRDIVNLTFTGENNRDSDVTSIRAGRDLTYVDRDDHQRQRRDYRGPGRQQLRHRRPRHPHAGRRPQPRSPAIDRGCSAAEHHHPIRHPPAAVRRPGGRQPDQPLPRLRERRRPDPVRHRPRQSDRRLHRPLHRSGRSRRGRQDLHRRAGGIHGSPCRGDGGSRAIPSLELSPEQALAAFRALSEPDQMPFIRQVYFAELRSIAPSPGSTLTVDQRRAYEAIDTLFPASTDPLVPGYTDGLAADADSGCAPATSTC